MGNLRKHLHSAILLWGLSLGLGSLPVVAQQVPQQTPNPDITRQELANFDRFLDTHPEIAKRSEEHTSELQSRLHLVCRLLLEKKKKKTTTPKTSAKDSIEDVTLTRNVKHT